MRLNNNDKRNLYDLLDMIDSDKELKSKLLSNGVLDWFNEFFPALEREVVKDIENEKE
ncbi:MAG: hypothetical protein ACOCQD_05340 [archaeon]